MLYPDASIDIRLSHNVSELAEKQVDLAIRFGFVADSGLIAEPFDQQALVVVAILIT